MYFYGIDATYIFLVLPAVIFALWAQFNVKSTFSKYSKIASRSGMTGFDSARRILDANGLGDVRIAHVSGDLTDHYNPTDNTIYLSDSVYGSDSAAAIGVAAHEAGHAVQHAVGYFPIRIRSAIIPITNIGSSLAVPLVIAGLIFSYYPLAYLGVICFGACVVFQLVTLPVEFNASRRALQTLRSSGVVSESGLSAAGHVLRAAAMTYVAALAVALGNLLRLISLANRSKRD